MGLFNLHTHSHFCDGKESPESYIKQALQWGFSILGFSSHAPVPFENKFAIPSDLQLEAYFREIRRLQDLYRDRLKIGLSLEIDFIPGVTSGIDFFRRAGNLDYTIGGVHFVRNKDLAAHRFWFIDGPVQEKYDEGLKDVFQSNPRKAVTAYFEQLIEMVLTQQPDIIAHLDKIKMHNGERFFSETEHWYKELVWKTLKAIAGREGNVIEVNTRGLYKKRSDTFFPGPDILEQILHLNIPVTVSTDAHQPGELLGYYQEALMLLSEIGFKKLVVFVGSHRTTSEISLLLDQIPS